MRITYALSNNILQLLMNQSRKRKKKKTNNQNHKNIWHIHCLWGMKISIHLYFSSMKTNWAICCFFFKKKQPHLQRWPLLAAATVFLDQLLIRMPCSENTNPTSNLSLSQKKPNNQTPQKTNLQIHTQNHRIKNWARIYKLSQLALSNN